MSSSSLRVTSKDSEIVSSIIEAIRNQRPITLWQIRDGERVILRGHFCGLDRNKGLIKMEINGPSSMSIDMKAGLYVHGQYRCILFKQDIVRISGRIIAIKMPHEVRLHELRLRPRFYFQVEDGIEVYAAPKKPIERPDLSDDEDFTLIPWPVMDISSGGLGFIIPKAYLEDFEVGTKISIHQITREKVPSNFWGKVVYLAPFIPEGSPNLNLFRVGVAFKAPLRGLSMLPPSELEGEGTESSDNDLSAKRKKDFFYGHTPDDLAEIIKETRIKEKRQGRILKHNIEAIERITFLTPAMLHTFFQSTDLTLIGTSLRISSEELVAHLLGHLPESIQEELLWVLKKPRPLEEIMEAQEKLIELIREKERRGEIVLDKCDYDTYL